MKIVNVIGGLGNQMFQYALAIALKRKYPEDEIKIDTQLYRLPIVKKYRGNNFYHNGFEIQKVFSNANLPIASCLDIMKVSYYIPNYILNKATRRVLCHRKTELIQSYKESYIFNSKVLDSSACYFAGYWMSPFYFDFCREDILETFSFSEFDSDDNRKWASMLVLNNSVTIHVRRGDYIGAENFKDICTLTYYRNAIAAVKSVIDRPVFFVFSNDQQWCIENLKKEFENAEVHFVDKNKGRESYRDMQLMSLARCNILANSSFSWWGAYLNQRDNHIVFCPEKWVNNLKCDNLLLKEWIKISGK